MPTPRHVTQIMQQIRTRAAAGSDANAQSDAWLRGVVTESSVVGLRVQLSSGEFVASSALDEALPVGTRVWAVNVEGTALVVGLQ
jgi:hypothetical protein